MADGLDSPAKPGCVPAILLVWSRKWRGVPPAFRLKAIFVFLAASWIALFSFGLRLETILRLPPGDIPRGLAIAGIMLGGIFFYLRKRYLLRLWSENNPYTEATEKN
jgi:hypothetical protein